MVLGIVKIPFGSRVDPVMVLVPVRVMVTFGVHVPVHVHVPVPVHVPLIACDQEKVSFVRRLMVPVCASGKVAESF